MAAGLWARDTSAPSCRAEVLAENIYALSEPPQEGLPFPKPKVESDALAPSALDRPHERVPVVERAQAAEELTYAWLFHLNDVCPELTQRAGEEARRYACRHRAP